MSNKSFPSPPPRTWLQSHKKKDPILISNIRGYLQPSYNTLNSTIYFWKVCLLSCLEIRREDERKKNEDKKAERQKAIEAKRSAKKGPMKLGAKKMID